MIRFSCAVLATAFCLTLPAAAPRVEAQDARVNWLTDRKQAFDQARKTGKPVWVLFR